MKKGLITLVFLLFLLTGCFNKDSSSIIKKLEKEVKNSDAYHLTGIMQIISNEEKYLYDVDVSYSKGDLYRVSLKNQTNNHEQIILKNKDAVYVLTPTLNKSFKFQSEWPYNSSQAYLLHSIIDDIKSDKDKKFVKEKDFYIYEVDANYLNNKELKKQKIYIDKNNNIKKVEILDNKNNVKISMQVKTIDFKAKYKENYFEVDENMETSVSKEVTNQKLNDIVYPMYLPKDTKLINQNKIKKEDGERIILNFGGESNFTLVEETIDSSMENSTIPVNGEITFVTDVFGSLGNNSISWISNNTEYYLTSNDISQEELLNIANSMSVLPVSK